MLTDTELSFHETIRSGDTAARLIYAGWLEDQCRYYESALLRSGHWCLIPAGSFWMGGGRGYPGKLIEKIPRYFYLGAYTVTQCQWEKVMGNNPSYFSRNGEGKDEVKDISDEDLRLFPVEGMSWDQAQEFIKELNDKEHDSGFLYRLPTGREWEYACRGAAYSEQECSFDFYFDKPTNVISTTDANIGAHRPTKVGSYKPNRLGLYDMHGNVWEWCDDVRINDAYRLIRGGNWASDLSTCRAVSCSSAMSSAICYYAGFRLAIIPPTH